MSRFFAYRQLVGISPAPAPLVVGLSASVSRLPAFGSGLAVIAGSAAWATPSWRSDIDVAAFKSDHSLDLESGIAAVRQEFTDAHGTRFICPHVDIVWVGAEREELVERDNLVSKSAPIKEPRTIAEIFERVCVRLIDHLESLARVQGDPWRQFVTRFLSSADHGASLRRDVIREYVHAIAVEWKAQTFLDEGPNNSSELGPAELDALGSLEGFAYHLVRQILGEKQLYPAPDRRGDVRTALRLLDDPLSHELSNALAPLFALGDGYEQLALQVQTDREIDEGDFYRRLRSLAANVDIDAVENFVWTYAAPSGQPREPL